MNTGSTQYRQAIYEDCFDYEIGFYKQKVEGPNQKLVQPEPLTKLYIFNKLLGLKRSQSAPQLQLKQIKNEKEQEE